MKLPTKLALGMISVLFAANIATAAERGARMDWNHYGMDCYGMNMMPEGYGTDPVAHANKHLDELKAALKLTNDQQPAWQKLSEQVNQQAKNMASIRDKMKAMPKTTPEQMAMMAEMMKDRSQDMAKMADAAKVFYATLTPEQKTAFDKAHMSPMRDMNRRGPKVRAKQPQGAQ